MQGSAIKAGVRERVRSQLLGTNRCGTGECIEFTVATQFTHFILAFILSGVYLNDNSEHEFMGREIAKHWVADKTGQE